MEIRLLEKNKDKTKASLVLRDFPVSYANTLRRLMIEEVPVMAIEDVELRKNSSVLYDEMIAHRLGLIPFTTDIKSYNLPSECTCKGEGCAKCQLKMTLKAKGAGFVYASDIKTKDPKVKPVFPKIPIVKLLKDQELELEATAVLGQGKEHAKWSPGLFHYKHKPTIEIDSKKCDACEDCVSLCPAQVLECKNKKLIINKDNLMNCTLCNACVDACSKKAIVVSDKSPDMIFYIESWGQLKAEDIAKAAIDMFDKQLDEFTKKLKS